MNTRINTREHIAKKIIELRTNKGLSAKQLSAELGLGYTQYCSWEQHKTTPKMESIEALAAFHDVNAAEITGWLTTANANGLDGYVEATTNTILHNGEALQINNVINRVALSSSYLEEQNIPYSQTVQLTAIDDSMASDINSGDAVLVNRAITDVKSRARYAVLVNGTAWIRWIQPDINGYIMSADDDSRYPSHTIENLHELIIIGRVFQIIKEV